MLAELLDAGQLRLTELATNSHYRVTTVTKALTELNAQGYITHQAIDARPGKSGRTMLYGLTAQGIEAALREAKEANA